MADRAPTTYDVPASTSAVKCRAGACAATIYFIASPKTGKPIPIDCNGDEDKAPTPTEKGHGVLHHIRCKRPDAFRPAKPDRRPDPDTDPVVQAELDIARRAPFCLFCGCTSDKRCLIPKPDVDPEHAAGEETHSRCVWLQTDPPVCSKDSCAREREKLPLKMRRPLQPTEA
jgi:hypothetical protein